MKINIRNSSQQKKKQKKLGNETLHCLITQTCASNYKVRVTEKRGKYSNRTAKTIKQPYRKYKEEKYKEKDEKYSTAGSLGIAETRVS